MMLALRKVPGPERTSVLSISLYCWRHNDSCVDQFGIIYNGFPSSLMLYLVEIINATFLFGVLLKLVGHPDSNSAIMFSFNRDRFIRIDLDIH